MNEVLVFGVIVLWFAVIALDKLLPAPTFMCHPELSNCTGCPISPASLSDTFDTIRRIPPELLMPVISLPATALFKVDAN